MALSFPSSASSLLRSPATSSLQADYYKFGFRREQHASILGRRTRSHAFQMVVLASKDSNKEVAMVDPLEAKRLAAKQMQEIQAKEKYKRKREIEAINGGWAMIGLTVGLVVEGRTGNGTLKQFHDSPDVILVKMTSQSSSYYLSAPVSRLDAKKLKWAIPCQNFKNCWSTYE